MEQHESITFASLPLDGEVGVVEDGPIIILVLRVHVLIILDWHLGSPDEPLLLDQVLGTERPSIGLTFCNGVLLLIKLALDGELGGGSIILYNFDHLILLLEGGDLSLLSGDDLDLQGPPDFINEENPPEIIFIDLVSLDPHPAPILDRNGFLLNGCE